MVAAGLFMRTFGKLATLDIGLDREAVLVVDVDAARSGTGPDERLALFERIREAAAAVPGVAGAGLSLITPVSGSGWNGPIELPDRPDVPTRERMSFYNSATPGWFATMGTRLRAGRDFNERDMGGAPKVGIPNEAFVKRYVKGTPIGQTIRYETRSERRWIRSRSSGSPRMPPIARCAIRFPRCCTCRWRRRMAEELREAEPQRSRRVRFTGAADTQRRRSHLARRSGCLADVPSARRRYIDGALVRERLLAMLSGFFAGLALLLAGIGLYGMTAYSVSRRRAEIGIRMALGAHSARVVAMVLKKIALPVCLGLVAGAGLSYWAARYVGTLLYDLDARDPLTFAGAAIFLAVVSLVAAWVPARRAAAIDPARVLHEG